MSEPLCGGTEFSTASGGCQAPILRIFGTRFPHPSQKTGKAEEVANGFCTCILWDRFPFGSNFALCSAGAANHG